MDLCLITPISHLDMTPLLPGRFCIGSVAVKHPKYKDYFVQASQDGYPVILDNGVFEGDIICDSEYIDLALEMKPKVLICPDILGGETTANIDRGALFAKLARQQHFEGELMIVMQCRYGEEDKYWEGLDQVLTTRQPFDWIGICRRSSINAFHKYTHAEDELNRYWFAHKLQEMYPRDTILRKKWHFLGIEERVDLLQYYWFVNSMDTASFFWNGMYGNGYMITNGVLPTEVKRPKDYFTRQFSTAEFPKGAVRYNCTEALKYAQMADVLKQKILNRWRY